MQLIDTIFQFSYCLFIACCKLFISFLCLCVVGFVPVAVVKSIIEKVRKKWKIKK